MSGVFDGIKVVDFTWAMVGPMTTRYLADYGATVIHVETATHVDILRTAGPFKDGVPGLDRAGYYAQYNVNKYGMTLNLNHPKGAKLVRKLIAWADVVAESYRAGTLERWGLGYEDLKKIKPDIIMLRTSMQGQTGPNSHLSGTGVNLVGLTGFAHLCGWPDRDPSQPYGPYTDAVAAHICGAVLIAALDYRRRTGKGQLLDISQFEAGVNFIAPVMLDYFVNNRVANRAGNYSPCAAPHNAYRCLGDDRWCAIAVFTDEEWRAFCQVIGNPPWTMEDRFATLKSRKENEAELDRLVEEWTVKHTAEEVMTLMQRAGVAAGVAQTIKELNSDPQLKHRGHYWVFDHKILGKFFCFSQLAKLSKTKPEPRAPAPCLGEHTEYVCREILKLSDEEFVELLSEGALE